MIKNRQGFTLIEILIVVAIIAILASVVLVGLGPTQQAGRDSRRISDLTELQNGLELYYNACGYYPGGAQASTPCGAWAASGYTGMAAALKGTPSIGISSVPSDPTAGHTYYYGTDNGGTQYVLGADLENKSNSVFTSYTTPSDYANINQGDAFPGACAKGNAEYCVTI